MPMLRMNIKGNLCWFFEKWYYYVVLLTFIAVCLLLFSGPVSERRVRICGLLLQFVGIFATILQIYRYRKIFVVPRIDEIFQHWIEKRPPLIILKNKKFYENVADGFCVFPSLEAEGYGRSDVDLFDRISNLEYNFSEMSKLMVEENKYVRDKIESIEQHIQNVSNELNEKKNDLYELIKNCQIGEIYLMAWGVFLVLVGTVLSALSDVVSAFLQSICA